MGEHVYLVSSLLVGRQVRFWGTRVRKCYCGATFIEHSGEFDTGTRRPPQRILSGCGNARANSSGEHLSKE